MIYSRSRAADRRRKAMRRCKSGYGDRATGRRSREHPGPLMQ
jgi:hypothetical protein